MSDNSNDNGDFNNPTPEFLRKKALADLARSGLDRDDFREMKLEILTREQTDAFVGEARASYRIPYFDIKGNRIAYSRVRFLENRKKTRFSGSKSKAGSFRYSQPFNSSPHIYFPPLMDWQKIARDPSYTIVITEGEKKAAAACKLGIPCIALGGVYGYRSSKRLQELIPEFYQVVWKKRRVDICYDADVMMKAEVRAALGGLSYTMSEELYPKKINFIFLDAEVAGDKTSLDDYLVSHGEKEFWKLPRHPYRLNSKIQTLNGEVAYVTRAMAYYDIAEKKFFKNFAHVREAFANRGEEIVDGTKTSQVIDLWNKSPNRRTFKNVEYRPGEDEVSSDNIFNFWEPPKVRSRRGDPKIWLDLVHHVMRKPVYAEWFLKWLAYPVQNLGAKLFTAMFVYSDQQGTGKTFVVDPIMKYVYGENNFYSLDNDDLQSTFNGYADRSQFVVTNEIYLSDLRDRRMMMGKLKDMITREKVTVNEKFQPKVSRYDHCNYYLTSNHADALHLEPNDRRFMVIEGPNEKLATSTYRELDDWVRNRNGASIVKHYLENSVDLSGFNEKSEAMRTPWRDQIIALSKDVFYEFAERIIENPDPLRIAGGFQEDLMLYRADDILRAFEIQYPRYRYSMTTMKMARLLKDSRLECRKVRLTADSPQNVLYAVFDRDYWKDKKNSEWAEHYTTTHRAFARHLMRKSH